MLLARNVLLNLLLLCTQAWHYIVENKITDEYDVECKSATQLLHKLLASEKLVSKTLIL